VRVIWRARAIADLGLVVAHISEENPIAAVRIGPELLLAGDSLLIFPRRGRPGLQSGTRELLAVYPYILLHRIDGDDDVVSLRLWHGAQDRR
jgi:plasmid stabilization system protein ParE